MGTYGVTIPKGNMPDFVLSATAAITYVTDPDNWPAFVAYMDKHHPDAAYDGKLADARLIVAHHALDLLRSWARAS